MTQNSSIKENILFTKGLSNLNKFNLLLKDHQSFGLKEIQKSQNEVDSEVGGKSLFNRITDSKNCEITVSTLWRCIFEEFKWEIFICYILKQMDFLMKITLSIFISLIFNSFQRDQRLKCYLFAGMVGLIWILQAIFSQSSLKQVEQNSLKIKGSLTYAIYLKVLSVSNFSINGNESGEIINAIIEFHDILENQAIYIFACLSAPLCIIGLTVLLVNRIGWMAMVGIGFYLLMIFIQYHYAKFNVHYYDSVSELKDQRMKILTQIVSAFRYIKMQVWEKIFVSKISAIRSMEMKGLIKYGAGRSLQISLNEGIIAASILLVIGLTAKINDALTSNQILESALYITNLVNLVIYSSFGINFYYRVNSLMQRVASVFSKQSKKSKQINQKERQSQKQKSPSEEETDRMISLKQVWCSYSKDIENQSILKQITVSIKKGEFIGVFGKVGEGKTTFLNLLANQIPQKKGTMVITEEVAFHQSEPALFSGSIQENILLGKKMNRSLYEKAIKYSCLKSDIQSMQFGDQTIVEEGAVNLSGGQRTRVCLARVIYADKPIMLLDDPLSSLDLRVIQKIMLNLIKLNKAEGKTIILATHQIHCLIKCDRYIQFKQKRLVQLNSQQISKLKQAYWTTDEQQQIQKDYEKQNNEVINQILSLFMIQNVQENQKPIAQEAAQTYLQKQSQPIQIPKFGFIVSFFTYAFQNKWNYLVISASFLFYALSQSLYAVFVFYLSQFDEIKAGTNSTFKKQSTFWMTLGIISACVFICNYFRAFLLNVTIQFANNSLHEKALTHMFKTNILELDKLGTEGIIDKFSTDLGVLDVGIMHDLSCQFIVFFIVIIQLILIAVINPIVVAFIVAIMVPNYIWYQYCNKVIAYLRQMDLQQKGPVIALFSETMNGLIQIDNMNAEDYMLSKLKASLNKSIFLGTHFRKAFRAYTAYLSYYTTLMIVGTCFAIIAMNDSANYTNFTFAAVFLVQINEWVVWAFSNATKINSTLVSVSRIVSLSNLKTEKQFEFKKIEPKSNQQKNIDSEVKICADESRKQLNDSLENSIELLNVSLKYGQGQNLALKNITITMQVGKKIALIGRTGSGKSSIIQVLYRLVEAQAESTYLIEGQNVHSMSIQTLRQKFTCIPQVPFLFSDTIRSNLDPFQKFTDQQITESLKKVCIYEYIEKLQSGINTSLASGEVTFSAGQKQLICLARAILQDKNFLILDEATSNIDQKTDQIIQTVLRKQFVGKTIISVAHRLQTILDFDKIIVLSKGQIVEVGTAHELWHKKGEFHQIIYESGYQKFKIIKHLENSSYKQ